MLPVVFFLVSSCSLYALNFSFFIEQVGLRDDGERARVQVLQLLFMIQMNEHNVADQRYFVLYLSLLLLLLLTIGNIRSARARVNKMQTSSYSLARSCEYLFLSTLIHTDADTHTHNNHDSKLVGDSHTGKHSHVIWI